MEKKPSIAERIKVFFISLIIMIFIFPILSYFINEIFMWQIIPYIPIVAGLIACLYDKFKK